VEGKKPHPEGVSLSGGFQPKIPEEENPLKNDHDFFKRLGLFFRGGSSFSGFLVWKTPSKETPLGGGGFTINVCVNTYMYVNMYLYVCVSV